MATIANKTKSAPKTKGTNTKTGSAKTGNARKRETIIVTQPVLKPVLSQIVSRTDIDFSPLQYRKYYSEQALLEFAGNLKLHGIIHAVTVRQVVEGRYELVAGERRMRGAEIAGLEEIPVNIRELTDLEVREIQLAENLQRENPHPMNEAQQIGEMQQVYKSIDEVAGRLGKSKQFVYSRLRLLSLIEPIREMFIEDVFTLQEAFDIAALSEQSQADFFSNHCEGWKEKGKFSISNLRWVLANYKYELSTAPFDTERDNLLPDVGACTTCPSNSATLNTLFPELAKNAVCSNKQCFQQKCNAYFAFLLVSEAAEFEPQGIVFKKTPSEIVSNALTEIPLLSALPQYFSNGVCIYHEPEMPDKADYDIDEEEELDDEGNPVDYSGYYAMMREYEQDIEEFKSAIASGDLLRALMVSDGAVQRIYFSLKQEEEPAPKVNAKVVTDAIKAGTVTVEMLQAEIERIQTKEKRAKELDREKVQLAVHTAFTEQLADAVCPSLTFNDMAAARYLIYLSLDWTRKNEFEKSIIPPMEGEEVSREEHLFQAFCKMTEEDFSYLIRAALAGKSDGKLPCLTGYFIYKVAEAANVNVAAIESTQAQKTKEREETIAERVGGLQYKIRKINGTTKSDAQAESTESLETEQE